MSSPLSKEAANLVNAGKSALRASEADKIAVRQALQQQLGLSAGTAGLPPNAANLTATNPAGGPSTPPAAAPSAATQAGVAWPKLAFAVAGVGGVIAAALLWPKQPPRVEGASVSVNSAPLPANSAPELKQVSPEPATLAETASVTEQSAPAERTQPTGNARTSADRLREEVALLTRAQKEFQAQRPNQAMALVDEHRRKFPRGVLIQERVTLRTRLLCALGRSAEADAEQARWKNTTSGETALKPGSACSKP